MFPCIVESQYKILPPWSSVVLENPIFIALLTVDVGGGAVDVGGVAVVD